MHLLSVYRVQFKVIAAIQLQYRVSVVIWLIGMVLQPTLYLVVWSKVTGSTGGSVSGYSSRDFAAYFLAMMLVNHATFSWVIWGFDTRIRQGTFSPALLRPVHPFHADFAENLSYKLMTLPVMVAAAIVLAVTFHPRFHPAPWALAAMLPAVSLAVVMRFVIEWTLALTAFWTTRGSAVNQIYDVLLLFLSGSLAPLTLFPAAVRLVADVLPFRWMLAFPVELAIGNVSPSRAALGLLAQAGWLAAGVVALQITWRAGARRYSAVGA